MSEKQKSAAAPEPQTPLPAYSVELAAEMLQPDITEKLLNAQLAEALFLMRDAGFLYRNTAVHAVDRGPFVDHAEKLMLASVNVAERIALLKKGEGEPAKRFHYTVERLEGGGGRRNPENE